MKALIIYDGFAAGAKASAALKHSTENLAFDVQWNVRPWRLDMLKFTPTLKQAMKEALDAQFDRAGQPDGSAASRLARTLGQMPARCGSRDSGTWHRTSHDLFFVHGLPVGRIYPTLRLGLVFCRK
jgi:hypothetical protein